jgi:hypothetical protein
VVYAGNTVRGDTQPLLPVAMLRREARRYNFDLSVFVEEGFAVGAIVIDNNRSTTGARTFGLQLTDPRAADLDLGIYYLSVPSLSNNFNTQKICSKE